MAGHDWGAVERSGQSSEEKVSTDEEVWLHNMTAVEGQGYIGNNGDTAIELAKKERVGAW